MKEILIAVVVCSGFWTVVNTVVMYFITKAQKRDESQQISKTEYDALCKGVRGLLYGELERRCTEYIEHGEISAGELNDLRKYYYCFNSQYVTPRVMIDKMLSWSFELNAAYSMKEEYAYINATSTPENAEHRIDNFIAELFIYDVRELTRIARMLRHWKTEIINSFDRVNGQRISNGPIESVNSRIKVIKQNGNGYRNFERFKLRVLYSLNDNSSIKS